MGDHAGSAVGAVSCRWSVTQTVHQATSWLSLSACNDDAPGVWRTAKKTRRHTFICARRVMSCDGHFVVDAICTDKRVNIWHRDEIYVCCGFRGCASCAVTLCVCENSDGWLHGVSETAC